jgi:hypothetical protein
MVEDKPELLRACADADGLWAWVRDHLGMEVPRVPFCAHHSAPFDYLEHAYFEPSSDVVVWGPRGGGKTRLAAVATLLDLLHKPGISVRILGGSLEQSLRVWEHLIPDLEMLAEDEVKRMKALRVELTSGSIAAALAQSQRAVRGIRVQKLRCDEVEMFDPEVWRAAGATTRSKLIIDAPSRAPAAAGVAVKVEGTVEALSTHHKPGGLMARLLDGEEGRRPRLINWCILDVMAKCGPEHTCASCELLTECGGRAKQHASGFMPVSDVIAIKRRVSLEMWEAEMLCLRPSVEGRVFPKFSVERHVRETRFFGELSLGVDFGYAAPFVALWIGRDTDGVIHVVDEWVERERTIEEHAAELKLRSAAREIRCDPAGRSRNEQTGKSSIDVLKRAGFKVKSRPSGIVEGVERIRRLVCDARGESRLVVHPRCKALIRALSEYHYPKVVTGELPEKDGTHDHPLDALRYWLANDEREGLKTAGY